MPYPVISAGQRITAGLLTSMLPSPVVKAADEPRASTTTNANDSHLLVPVAANATYLMSGMLLYSARTDTDIKIGFTGPSGATLDWIAHGQPQDGTGGVSTGMVVDKQSIGATAFPLGGYGAENTTVMTAPLFGRLVTSASAGTLQLNWAQRVTNATSSIMRAGSWILLTRVA
ncbi:hypothetical protein [Streptomyces sp. W1SF4]|uniref:hypothetical protein n=1 Tax=Streptomyces sp. W1SF4 TaxID=2305220 RepID=UPI000F6C6598|nr:hypothetical protein [Streptomyces sp. W1SF4]AZM91428.1 hypothetical protein D1J60_25570 [Streptomyces sp. W1SF4]